MDKRRRRGGRDKDSRRERKTEGKMVDSMTAPIMTDTQHVEEKFVSGILKGIASLKN